MQRSGQSFGQTAGRFALVAVGSAVLTLWLSTHHVRAESPSEAAAEAAEAALELAAAGPAADPARSAAAEAATGRGSVTNLPVPRFVSLKAAEGNVRRGPSLSHRIDWVFRHRDMPLRVTAEFGHWRRIEDRDGVGGWVHYSLISGVRTVVFTTDKAELHSQPDAKASLAAVAENGAVARVTACRKEWCRVSAEGQIGWVSKLDIWGVDPGEVFD